MRRVHHFRHYPSCFILKCILIYTTCFLPDVATCLSSAAPVVDRQLLELQKCYQSHYHSDTAAAISRSSSSSRNLLQRRHAAEFLDDSLFHKFARTVCQANAVPRKELFETWAVAIHIQHQFSDCRRVADLACGHGLLAWALLVLDERPQEEEIMPRTAVCIDKRMPLSAGKVAAAMLQEYPSLQGRWHFVEGKLGAVTINSKEQNQESSSSSSNTLLCGIHACGILSDQILALAVQGSAPVVLLPCCHTKKSLDEMERKDYDQNNQMVSVQQDGPKKEESNKEGSLAEFVDLQRIKRLQQAGYDVQRTYIPRQFTPQNSIILASPPLTQQKSQSPPSSRSSRYRKGSLPHGHVLIPIDDTTTAKTIVRSMAGRDAAMARKLPPSPAFCVSLAMPEDKHHHVKPKGLSALVDGILSSNEKRSTKPTYGATLSTRMTIHVDYADSEAFFHASSARYFRTFRIEYGIDAKLDRDIHKEAAMELHKEMCRQIPVEFPGCTVRS